MKVTISQDELKGIILEHLKKRGIEIDVSTIKFEDYEQYEGWHELDEEIRAVATIKEEGKPKRIIHSVCQDAFAEIDDFEDKLGQLILYAQEKKRKQIKEKEGEAE
jgi:hypothetical protein